MRGISPKMLGEFKGGINKVTIRKYEADDRNPKSDQLLKITHSLRIRISLFVHFDIETVSEVLSLVFKMDEQADMEFKDEKNLKGIIDPKTLTLLFIHSQINERLLIVGPDERPSSKDY